MCLGARSSEVCAHCLYLPPKQRWQFLRREFHWQERDGLVCTMYCKFSFISIYMHYTYQINAFGWVKSSFEIGHTSLLFKENCTQVTMCRPILGFQSVLLFLDCITILLSPQTFSCYCHVTEIMPRENSGYTASIDHSLFNIASNGLQCAKQILIYTL